MLRDYQIFISEKACALLVQHKLCYLSMEVRTGKTMTALAAAQLYGASSVLFITKIKAISSIQKDYEALKPSFDLYVINYEQVHNLDIVPDVFILDEAHCLSAYPKPAEKTKALKKLCEGRPIIYLSGSPSPESFSQLYHQLFVSSFSPFAAYKNFYAWAKEFVYVQQRRFSHGIVNDYSKANQKKIEAAVKHLFISYTQSEAGFTQAVQEHVITVRMKPFTYELANTLRTRRVYTSPASGRSVVADTEVSLMGKLQQIYSGTVLDENGQSIPFDNSKVNAIAENFKGKKVAVFYKYKAEADLLTNAFNCTTSPDVFARSGADVVFISQIVSGREGINLSTADALIFFNIDFSHVSYIQARARLQTMERQAACNLYWLFAEGGIEQKVYERVRNKEDYQLAYFKKDYDSTANLPAVAQPVQSAGVGANAAVIRPLYQSVKPAGNG